MDIRIRKYSFNVKTLKTNSKEKILKSFKDIPKEVVEEAWNEANPRKRAKAKSKTKV